MQVFTTFGIIGNNNKRYTSWFKNTTAYHDCFSQLMWAKSKLSSIHILISQALIHMKISHEEFVTILKEKGKYEKMKENFRSENENQEIMRLSSIKSKT